MRKRSQGQFTRTAKAANPEGWEFAISEAEKEIAEHEARIGKLRLAISIFQDMKEAGEPFTPSAADAAVEQKAA
jgi:hypothetical protein